MRVAVPGAGFVEWGGGIDLLRVIVNGLLAAESSELEATVLLPSDSWLRVARRRASALKGSLLARWSGRPVRAHRPFTQELEALLVEYGGRVGTSHCGTSARSIAAAAGRARADVVLPAFDTFGRSYPLPWIGYVYDFQHRHLPELFTDRERMARDRRFRRILSDAPVTVANARAVQEDARRFLPDVAGNLVALPFAAAPNPDWFQLDVSDVRAKYGIRDPYFLISNQFWTHKDHSTAFRALRTFREATSGAARLICTGVTHDWRAPEYFVTLQRLTAKLGITESIDYLGYISKSDQIALMRGAIAVVQPTRFEGGPGGGAIWDAVSVGAPAILSDIAVNREIENERGLTYFKVGDPDDLARAMLAVAAAPRVQRSPTDLIADGRQRLGALGTVLIQCAELARSRADRKFSAAPDRRPV